MMDVWTDEILVAVVNKATNQRVAFDSSARRYASDMIRSI